MKIKLVKNGIFPITKDLHGNLIEHLPDTGYNISGTIQGEGLMTGVPSIFIRTSGCTMRCAWEMESGEVSLCDTPYSSHNATEFDEWEIVDIINTVSKNLNEIRHIVITGGEPTMQHNEVAALAYHLKQAFHNDIHITIETNGSAFYKEVADNIDLYSISPKLKDSIPYVNKLKKLGIDIDQAWAVKQALLRKNINALQQYIDMVNDKYKTSVNHELQLKFVISKPENIDEIKTDFLDKLHGWNKNQIYLMPVGRTKEQLLESGKMVLKLAIENGFRFCPRLHIELFGDKAGV